MFEKLAGKVLTRLLSKYFVSSNDAATSSQLGVWSGYICLERLQLRTEVVNELLQTQGIGLQLVSCTLERVELTIPWAKLKADPNAVCIVVVDGVHALLRTHYEYDDALLRLAAIRTRRQQLEDISNKPPATESSSWTSAFHRRITEGLIRDILQKLHVHVRNVHMRLEDATFSKDGHAFACGVTWESMHIQAHSTEEESDGAWVLAESHRTCDGCIEKVAFLNHFAVYWNPMEQTNPAVPVEVSVLHRRERDPWKIARALDRSIVRRASDLATSNASASRWVQPNHFYFLCPVDARCSVSLSSTPEDLSARPALELELHWDNKVSFQLRDYQLIQVQLLVHGLKEHKNAQPYRAFRPLCSVHEDPRAWWQYAISIVRKELRESRMRWSWGRFHQRFALRRRYCELYERQRRFPRSKLPSSPSRSSFEDVQNFVDEVIPNQASVLVPPQSSAPDDGAGPQARRLTLEELDELIELEDGIRGDLSVHDIILYRALANARLAGITTATNNDAHRQPRFQSLMGSIVTEEIESEEEYARLLEYLDSYQSLDGARPIGSSALIAVLVKMKVDNADVSLFAPLLSTTDLQQSRRLHERFFEAGITAAQFDINVLEGYKSFNVEASLQDLLVKEIRSNRKEFVVVARSVSGDSVFAEERLPLWQAALVNDPPETPEYDIGFRCELDKLEVILTPSNQWLCRLDRLFGTQVLKGSSLAEDVEASVRSRISLAANRAGLLARAEAAINSHKNLDLDITFQLPSIHVWDGADMSLVIDFGKARFRTNRLAGLSMGKLSYAVLGTQPQESPSESWGPMRPTPPVESGGASIDSSKMLGTPTNSVSKHLPEFGTSPKRLSDGLWMGSSVGSLRSLYRRGTSTMSIGESINVLDPTVEPMPSMEQSPDSHFYDDFALTMSESMVFLKKKSSESGEEMLSNLELHFLLSVSVIPLDHTICRLRMNCKVDTISLCISRASLNQLGLFWKRWKIALTADTDSEAPSSPLGLEPRVRIRDEVVREISGSDLAPQAESVADTSSLLDENEFMDASEGNEDEGREWMNWMADTESEIDGMSFSSKSDKRRRPPSASDVSSISERSARAYRTRTTYLNAENLARLEETNREDESEGDSDDESFHSAFSALGRSDLINALKEDIKTAENELRDLKDGVSYGVESLPGGPVVLADRRQRKLQIDRAEAELRALRASLEDLLVTPSHDAAENSSGPLINGEPQASERQEEGEDATVRARSVLRFRKNRDPDVNNFNHGASFSHTREIVRFFLSVGRVSFAVSDISMGDAEKPEAVKATAVTERLCLSSLIRSHDTKISLSVNKVTVGVEVDNERGSAKFTPLLSCGTDFSTMDSLLPSLYPQFLALIPQEERGFRIVIDRKDVRFGGPQDHTGSYTKARFVVGDIEVSPYLNTLKALLTLSAVWGSERSSKMSKPLVAQLRHADPSHSSCTDVVGRFSSCRLRLLDSLETVGAVAITESAVRFARIATLTSQQKSQLELRVVNVQVLGMDKGGTGEATEIFGRLDHYNHLLNVRCRLEEVEATQTSGWAVGGAHERSRWSGETTAINCHVTLRLKSPHVCLAKQSLVPVLGAIEKFSSISASSSGGRTSSSAPQDTVLGDDEAASKPKTTQFRWRVDFVGSSFTCTMPSRDSLLLHPYTDISSPSVLRFSASFHATLERVAHNTIMLSLAVTDVSLVRTSDAWPFLEKTTATLVAVLTRNEAGQTEGKWRLVLPKHSPWNRTNALPSPSVNVTTNIPTAAVEFVLSPVRFNVSPELCGLLMDWKNFAIRPSKEKSEPSPPGVHWAMNAGLRLQFPSIEIRLLEESQTQGGMSVADPKLSMCQSSCIVDVECALDRLSVEFQVGEFAVTDLSSLPGIHMIGPKPETKFLEARGSALLPTADNDINEMEIELELAWGNFYVLVLPTFFQSILSFESRLRAHPQGKGISVAQSTRSSSMKEHEHFPRVDFRLTVAGLEFVVSSQQLFEYIRDRSEESIGVVTFRSAFSVTGAVVPSSARVKDSSQQSSSSFQARASVAPRLLSGFLETHRRNFPLNARNERALAFLCDLTVSNFQALRTTIRKSDLSGDSTACYTFVSQPPARGEQRITNTINVTVKYRAAGIRWRDPVLSELRSNFAQSIQVESDLVDILAYVNQSERGVSKAFVISIQPILDSFRDQRSHVDSHKTQEVGRKEGLMWTISKATTICSVNVQGLKITCVPGGATRLTESPIIKATAKNFRLGVAALQVPAESTPLVRVAGTESHTTIGMWLATEVSANYHNRRLVAWEPVLEPWDLAIRFGADLVRLFGFQATMIHRFEGDRGASPRLPLLPDALQERAGETLRDFGRLLRSPFYSDAVSKAPNDHVPGSSVLDLPFFLLVILDQSSVTPALFSNYERSIHLRRNVPNNPHDDPIIWLEQFGFPSVEKRRDSRRPPLLIAVSDRKTMNINLTGALIENMEAYFGKERLSSGVPHMIRNNTGVTIRFAEVLDQDRRQRREKASKVTLGNGKEIPLSLRRSRSQSCDPHQGFIQVEMGRLEETHSQRHKAFLYELVGNLPVDTVGVETMVVREKKNHAVAVGVVIVRVILRGGVKIVSLESPMLIQNISDVRLSFEVREGGRRIWKSNLIGGESGQANQTQAPFAVPFHVVQQLDSDAAVFLAKSVGGKEQSLGAPRGSLIQTPPPFSNKSVSEGLVVEEEVFIHQSTADGLSSLALSVGGLRVGADSMKENAGSNGARSDEAEGRTIVPEQRMILIRPPLMFKNYLPVPFHLFVRVKRVVAMLSTMSSSNLMGITGFASTSKERSAPVYHETDEWVDLGILGPCQAVSWTGAGCEDKIELKIKLLETSREASRQFPLWSTTVVLPSCQLLRKQKDRIETNVASAKLKLKDKDGISLSISVLVRGSLKDPDPSRFNGVRDCTASLGPAPMIVEFVVPFWIVDTTGKELEFVSEHKIAGQSDRVGEEAEVNSSLFARMRKQRSALKSALGLGELMETDAFRDFKDDALRICMLGDAKASTLSIRRNISRTAEDDSNRRYLSSWCEPVVLRSTNVDTDVYVPIPHRLRGRSKHRLVADMMEPLALHAKVTEAPEEIGGKLTRVIHIFNRYEVVNYLGRDIEILADQSNSIARMIPSDGHPVPYHFDDSNPIRFRPREFGWKWSGLIFVRRKRREVTTRLVHRMKGWTVIVTVEFISSGSSPGTFLVFRVANKPPFRLENHTMHPLCFGQTSMIVQHGDAMEFSLESVLLPFHKVDYAYEEPDEAGKSVLFDLADAHYSGIFGPSTRLGKFALERIAPGSSVKMWNSNFWGKVEADGPIRVLQIFDATLPKSLSVPDDHGGSNTSFTRMAQPSETPSIVEIRLSHGIGVSVVDWVPQELMYLRLGELFLERSVDDQLEEVVCSIPHLSIDNQLWITPYPVLLKMGKFVRQRSMERRRRRRNEAVHVSWRRRLTQEGELTIFEQLDVAVEPIVVRADGYLFELGMRMIQEASGRGYTTSGEFQRGSTASLIDRWRKSRGQTVPGDGAGDGVALIRSPRSTDAGMGRTMPIDSDSDSKQPKLSNETFDVARNKFYIDRFKISTVAAEVSWTGPLPIAFSSLPDMLRPALTFEALPVRLRPYTSQHCYGSVQDISDGLKLHYMSFWRVLDILSGLPLRPSFIVRACFYTWRESLSSLFDKVSKQFTVLEKGLLGWSPQELVPLNSSKHSVVSSVGLTWLYRMTLGRTALSGATWSRAWANGFGRIASVLRYDGGKVSGDALAVRSREPRLFAHVDGKELLVDYVEGKNAGKALLSRVRRGQHLGEGYVYHLDTVYESRQTETQTHFASKPLILIATAERLLLLHGRRDNRFCSVVWESSLIHLVELESEEKETAAYLKLWYMADGTRISPLNHNNRLMESAADDTEHGLDILLCKTLITPKGTSGELRVELEKFRVIGGWQNLGLRSETSRKKPTGFDQGLV